jgi:hypothetical protein
MRIVLLRPAERSEIDALALAQGWRLVQIAGPRGRPREVTFATADGTALVTFVDAHDAERACVRLACHDPSDVAAVIRGGLACEEENG